MPFTSLITPQELLPHLSDPNWLVIDGRFLLGRPNEKEMQYSRAHIPGAVYAHLKRNLSAPVEPGLTGRHPLPSREETARRFGEMGVGPETQVVVYDDFGGALAAGRAWWLLRWIGHEAVAILDGGWPKWLEEDYPTMGGVETRSSQPLPVLPALEETVDLADVERIQFDPSYRLIDVRAGERYRGETEPIDRIPGHIPGAINLPYTSVMAADHTFLSPEALRAVFTPVVGDTPAEQVVFYCGSGVTSVPAILAFRRAGLGAAKLYPGSYSEWIADGTRLVVLGDTP